MSNEELVAGIQAGEDRMGELWEQVKGLVAWKANHIMTALELRSNPCGVEFEDLYQSGYIAMVEAVHYYNPEGGVAFSTCLINRLKTVFAEATGYRTKRGQNEPLNNSFSLDKTVDDESDGTPFGEFVPDQRAAATLEAVEEREYQKQLHDALEIALRAVPENYGEVLRLRYYQDMTLEECGGVLGVGAERVRQMENKGIRILRQPKNAVQLRPFFDFDFFRNASMGAFLNSGMSVQERYLIAEEDVRHRQRSEIKRRKEKVQREVQDTIERIRQEAQAEVARMTPEEKRALLEKYGFA